MVKHKLQFKEFNDEMIKYKISDLVEIVDCKHDTAPTEPEETIYKMIRTGNVRNGKLIVNTMDSVNEETYQKWSLRGYLEPNDIILTREAPMGEVALIPNNSKYKFFLGQRCLQLKTNNEIILPIFMYLLLQSKTFNNYIRPLKSSGSTVSNIRIPELKSFEFFVPSINEQKKIGNLFTSLNKKIQLQQEKINLLKEQKKACQLKFLNNKEWKTIRLGDYADIKGRLGWKGLKQDEYVDNGPFLIAGKHIIRGEIQWDRCDMIPFERYEESMEIALENGDVIFSKDGSLGNPAYITTLPDKATINSTMMLVRVHNKKELDSNFVYHILNSHIFRKLIHLKVSGSSIPHLFQADMKEFAFSIPKDINEQKQIVNLFNLIDRKIYLSYEKLDSLKAQKQAFMQQMFI